ncbi:PEP-CTERM sorting domain-containing protein [Paludisphaera rhizosphaerae]|uniref:PEP-CTERM sorting domain-containing protein n=1 Tax=Paludisphaera rhizosphaerae TaxID=2711216 RepID=UPI0013E9ADEC|nr:PEP-CTERM sorting domain-containing protein [Paludisphaera rhizosphaerae]
MRHIALVWVMLVSLSLGVPFFDSSSYGSSYKVTVLSDSSGTVYPTQLNNLGQVTGTYWQVYPTSQEMLYKNQPYFYDPNAGGRVTLPAIISPANGDPGRYNLRYAGSTFSGLNDKGQAVVGSSNGAELYNSSSGQYTNVFGQAGLLTNSGEIIASRAVGTVGGMTNYVPSSYQNGVWKDLGLPEGAIGAKVQAINNAGDVLVQATMNSSNVFAQSFVLRNETWTDLGSFHGQAINDQGAVAGYIVSGELAHAALRAADGTTTDLGMLSGNTYGIAYGINNHGDVVGRSSTPGKSSFDTDQGFLYHDGVMTNLNDLIDPASGWRILGASAINDLGQILASARNFSFPGTYAEVLLTPGDLSTPPDAVFPELPYTPVPEPTTLMVFGAMAVGVGLARRRREG